MILWLFVLLGPWGNLLTPSILPKSFRTYYLLLPLFPLFFRQTKQFVWQTGSFFLPFFIYSFFSILFVTGLSLEREEHQFFRFWLLFSHVYFVIGLSSKIEKPEQLISLVFGYLQSFFLVILIGYAFFSGYYLGWVSLDLLDRCSVLLQFGYGMLRFSPGSYPNEFGTLSSFVLCLLLLTAKENLGSKWFRRSRPIWVFLTLGALILSTTRAAYLCFLLCFLRHFNSFAKRPLFFSLAITSSLLWLFSKASFLSILSLGFGEHMHEGSLGERYSVWYEAFISFLQHPFLGEGFGAFPQLHNVYLALLFELGVLGALALLLSAVFFWLSEVYPSQYKSEDRTWEFLRRVRSIGLIHVFWFAASNHNLHHHLTWFVFFLSFSMIFLEKMQASQKSNPIL